MSQILLKNLENYVIQKNIFTDSDTKILVLSGASIFEEATINYETKVRIDTAMNLSKKYNISKIYYSGIGKYNNDINKISKYFDTFELKKNTKIIYETSSRNTYQNLSFIKSKFDINNKDNSWIIVTSAFHFKRVAKVTEKLNWRHQNFRAKQIIKEINFFDFNNWQYLSIYLKEEIAIIYYRFRGYI